MLPVRARPPLLAPVPALVALLVLASAHAAQPGSATPSQPATQTAEQPSEQPGAIRRFVRSFDFDDANDPDPVPDGWLWAQEDPSLIPDPGGRTDGNGRPLLVPRVIRPGYPAYNRAIYDRTIAHSGIASVRLPTKGGSTALRLESGEIPIFADADYGVSAMVRTRGLDHARAFVSARLLDSSLKPIEGSHVRSRGVSDADTRAVVGPGGWTQVSVAVPGRFPNAAWLQVELELLQPDRLAPDPALGAHGVRQEDLDADAWFDDVLVFLQPRASIRTIHPFNVAKGDQQPTLEVAVRDLGGDRLTATLSVFDLDGRLVAHQAMPVDPTGVPMQWQPKLDAFGWYTARLDVIARHEQSNPGDNAGGHTVVVASDSRAFAWLAPSADLRRPLAGASAADLRHVGVVLDPTDDAQFAIDAAATMALGARFAILPAWWPETLLEDAAKALTARIPALDALLGSGIDLTLCIDKCPDQITQQGLSDPYDLSRCLLTGASGGDWDLYLRPTLDRYGQRILRYQLGWAGREELFHQPGLDAALTGFERSVSRLVPGPRMTIGWRADQARPAARRVDDEALTTAPSGASPGTASDDPATQAARRRAHIRKPTGALIDAVTLLYPASFPSSVLMDAAEPWLTLDDPAGSVAPAEQHPLGARPPSRPELTLVLELPNDNRLPQRVGPRELVRRMVRAWEVHNRDAEDAPPLRLALARPWTRVTERGRGDTKTTAEPHPAWPAFAFAADALAGRRIVGAFPSEPGAVAFILAARDERSGQLTRGAIVGWNEHADPELSRLNIGALGSELRVVDCFGNPRELSEDERADGLRLGDMPVFVEGVDANLALFVAGFSVEPRFVRSSVTEHEHTIILTNPWPIRITGSLQIREAPDADGKLKRSTWNITPSGILDFAIGPNERRRIPFTFTFGPGQVVGPKRLEVLTKVNALTEHPLLKLKFALDIGLEDLQLELETSQSPTKSGPDLVVTAAITNSASRSRTLRVEAATRDYPTQQLQVSDLGTGQTVVRRFIFKDAGGPKGSGRMVIVSVSDLEEADRLNKMVEVP